MVILVILPVLPVGEAREEIRDLRAHPRGVVTAFLDGMGGAALEVVQQEFLLGRAQRGVNGGELLQDVRAVPFILHHAGDAPDLSPDTGQPTAEVLFRPIRDPHRMRPRVAHRHSLRAYVHHRPTVGRVTVGRSCVKYTIQGYGILRKP